MKKFKTLRRIGLLLVCIPSMLILSMIVAYLLK
jgi:hypothetical protein